MSWSFVRAGTPSKVVAALRAEAEKAQPSCEPEVQASVANTIEQALVGIPDTTFVAIDASGSRSIYTADGKVHAWANLNIKLQTFASVE